MSEHQKPLQSRNIRFKPDSKTNEVAPSEQATAPLQPEASAPLEETSASSALPAREHEETPVPETVQSALQDA